MHSKRDEFKIKTQFCPGTDCCRGMYVRIHPANSIQQKTAPRHLHQYYQRAQMRAAKQTKISRKEWAVAAAAAQSASRKTLRPQKKIQ